MSILVVFLFNLFIYVQLQDVLHDERQSLYSRFYISGRDMSASFVDKFSGDNGDNIMNDLSKIRLPPTSDYTDQFYYILDRCGMSVVVDQVNWFPD